MIEEKDRCRTAGPDGFNGCFYKICLNITKSDLFQAMCKFFAGIDLPKSWTSTLVVPLPMLESPSEFKHLRLTSLCINFSSKIISKLLCN